MGQLTFQATLGGAVNLAGPNTASTTTFTLPAADGTSGQPLQTNGSGTLSFATLPVGGGGGAGAVGAAGAVNAGNGGAGANSSITGSVVTYAGGIGPYNPNDGWIQVVGNTGQGKGNLLIMTGTSNTSVSEVGAIKFSIGNQAVANIFGYMSRENYSPTGNATFALGKNTGANYAYTLDVVGAANVASLYINGTQVLGESFALPVGFGGTGLQSVTANTVLYGNGTSALGMSNAPTAGQVLQYRTDGVKFGGLDGGTF